MNDYKTILQLHFDGFSQRKIAEKTRKSRNTISAVVEAATNSNLSPQLVFSLSEDKLEELLFPDKVFIPVYQQPDFEYCHKELPKPGVREIRFNVFSLTLSYSREHIFIYSPNKGLEDFLHSFIKAINKIGGVCEECIFLILHQS